MSIAPVRPTPFQRLLNLIERAGNILPNSSTLFAGLAVGVVLLSWWLSELGAQAVHPATGQIVQIVNLCSLEGLHRMLVNIVPNFMAFPPLGNVLVCLLGIAVAERTGLISAALRLIVLKAPRRLLTPILIFGGIMSHSGGDIGYVLMIPLGAAVFHTVGRHPIAGLAAVFAGVSGGFSANLLISTLDPLLAGITQAAAAVVKPGIVVLPTANYYFLFTASFLLTAIGTVVTEKIVEPRLGPYTGAAPREELKALTTAEKRGLWWTACGLAMLAAVILWGLFAPGGFLLDPKNPTFLASYFMRGLIGFIFLIGLTAGLAYGLGARTIRSDSDVVRGMDASMATMASYIVMAFFAAQFLAYFNWTNLGTVLAVNGAEGIKALGLDGKPVLLMVALVLLSAGIDLVMGSASAKWTLMAPIFVPMFMLLGYSPELVQGAYRIGDSCSNIISPLMLYFPLVLGFAQRYVPSTGIGTMIATMMPYSITFIISWTSLLIIWIVCDIPMGPGAPLFLAKAD